MYYPRGGLFFSICFIWREIKASEFSSSSRFASQLPLVQFYRKLGNLYLLSTPQSSPPHPSSPDLAGVLRSPCQLSALANLFTQEGCRWEQESWAREGRTAPAPWLILRQRRLFLATFVLFSASPCQCFSQRHCRQVWTIHSKNTGLMGGLVFSNPVFTPMWWRMCHLANHVLSQLQFSDYRKEGHGEPTEAGRRAEPHASNAG